LCKQGLTFKLRLFASLYFGSGLTEFCWAFSFYLVLLFLYWASVPGWTINNALPAQSPIRWWQYNRNTLHKSKILNKNGGRTENY
jgi:hypothetical protein